MAPVELLGVQPGDYVLDLCAAPGGKSTQIAAKLQGKGVLVTNDIHSERTKALAKNVELYGVRNAVVLNESPERIAGAFPHYFNKVLIDAPCSGEGMFRKDEDMVKSWEHHSVEKCVLMQRDILETAAKLLAPGGTIVYSTCTFAPEENEAMIAEFLNLNPDFTVHDIPETAGFAPGRPDWVRQVMPETAEKTGAVLDQTRGTARLWPHLLEGEGHYVAVLQHRPETSTKGISSVEDEKETVSKIAEDQGIAVTQQLSKADRKRERLMRTESRERTERPARGSKNEGRAGRNNERDARKSNRGKGRGTDQVNIDPGTVYQQFIEEHLELELLGETVFYGDRVYQSSVGASRLEGLKVIRPGWFMGTVKNGRFVPSHPLACALNSSEAKRVINLDSASGEAVRYLKGETLNIEEARVECKSGAAAKGYALVCVDGYALGWGKWLDGVLKNEYPAGWRWTSV